MTGLTARVVIGIALAAAWSCATRAAADSVYTSIRPADCLVPPKEVAAPYTKRDLDVMQCPAPSGWRLLLVSSDANTWIDIAAPGVVWSSERPIVYESPIGNFPSVGGSPRVEWRRDNSGRLTTLIFRVTAQDRETFKTGRSVLYVVRLQENGACVLGRPVTNEEARKLADSATTCR